jgi:hypothetical protein
MNFSGLQLNDVIASGIDILYLVYLLTAIGLSPGGSSTVHIYTQTVQQ